jgi:hypothetical protein
VSERKIQTETEVQRTTSLSTAALRRAFEEQVVTQREEQVLRMRYGIHESGDHVLESKARDNQELRAKLAMIEIDLLDLNAPDDTTGAGPNRDLILQKLKRL